MKNNIRYSLFIALMGLLFLSMNKNTITYSENELLGKERPHLVGDHYNLRPEVAKAFEKMREAAKQDGIALYSMSSYRSFEHQERIWNRKYERYSKQGFKGLQIIDKIIQYSTIPGTSRHHWGTDLDVIDRNVTVAGDKLLPKNYQKGGVYEKLGDWLRSNAKSYGFYLVYTDKENRKGFKYEPWHLSYKSTSFKMLKE